MSALAKSAKKQLILAGDDLLNALVQLHDVYLLPLVLLLDIGRHRQIVIILRYRTVVHQLREMSLIPLLRIGLMDASNVLIRKLVLITLVNEFS